MDDLLPKLLSFPQHPPPTTPLTDTQYDESIRAQITAVKSIPDSKLLTHTSSGESVLEFINPAINTVPYTFTLLATITALQKGSKNVKGDNLWGNMTGFLATFDPRQIRYLGSELSTIIETVVEFARRRGEPGAAVAPVSNALLRYDPTGGMLTSKHLVLVRVALSSRQLANALPTLDKPILYFPTPQKPSKSTLLCNMSNSPNVYITSDESGFSRKLKYWEVLEYFLYRGMIYMGTRNWKKSHQSLEDAFTFPTKDGVVSKIQIDAYKKWVLVGLLLEGKILGLPKVTGSGPAKAFHVIAKPYEAVAQIFESGTATRLKAEVDAGNGIWQNDCNMGLILHVLAAYQKNQIRNLASIYAKMSIQEVHTSTQSAETGARLPNVQATETLVRSMIVDGSLRATLSAPPNLVLSFSLVGQVLSEPQFQRELAASTTQIKALTDEIKHTDHMLTHEKEYIKWLQKQKKSGKNPVDLGVGMDMDWNGEDEDLMAGAY
ncbi:COP9 signalosome complex subunit [Lachnellula occidentalis]|uniref:COP9 signalosome complex subunit n=1 Tax=Lachnellula occidentalis TaxID=215460 RepID=A0A8H8UKM7_9HELO|nr:COP9 signalosome complex subunit [Lachnellula occidentalis]